MPWLGRLPGDTRWEGEPGTRQPGAGSAFYFPIVTCLLLSLPLSIVLWIVRQVWQ